MSAEPTALSGASRTLRWANAPKLALVLFTLVESGVWNRLARGAATAAELAADCGLDPERLGEALDLLVHFELAAREGDRFRLPTGAESIAPLIRLEAELHRELVRSQEMAGWLRGAPTRDPLDGSPPPETVELYLRGFEAVSERVALGIWRTAGLTDRRHLLDLGGAAGAHAAVFVRLGRELEVTVVDREVMRPFWQERVAGLDGGDRIAFAAGDLTRPAALAPLLEKHDAVLLSNVLHLLAPERRRDLAEQVLHRCRPGARLIVHDLFLDTPDREMAGLMNVDWMLLGARFSMTTAQCGDWLGELGFAVTDRARLPGLPSGVVVAAVPPLGGRPGVSR